MPLVLAVILIATVAIGLWFTSGNMVGGVPDSIAYRGAASNISAGRGLTTPFALMTERASPLQQVAWGNALPLSEQPPGYPLALAAADGLGFPAQTGARVVSIVGLVLLATAVAGAARIGLGRRALPIVAITVLALIGPGSPDYGLLSGPLPWSPLILSERLALPLSLLALTVCAIKLPELRSLSPRTLDRIRLALVAAVIFASTLTRFTGIACGVACAVAIAADGRRTRRSRVLWASMLLAIGPATIIGISVIAGGSPKTIAWHPSPIFEPLVDVMGQWFLLPKTLPIALRAVVLVLLVIAPIVLAVVNRGRTPDRRTIALALGTYSVVYVTGLILTVLFLDAIVDINPRFLTPVQASVYLLLAIEIVEVVRRYWPKMQLATLALLSIAALAVAFSTITQLADARSYWGFLHNSEVTANAGSPLHNIPRDTFIFTDDPPEAWNAARLTAYKLPLSIVATTTQPNPAYEDQIDQVVSITNDNDSLVVASADMRPETDIDAYISRGLVVLARCPDLTIIGRSGSSHTADVTRAPCTAPEPV